VFSSEASPNTPSGFGNAFAKFNKMVNEANKNLGDDEAKNISFASMLRHSKLIQLGDASAKVLEGHINEVVGDDLYIDFGGKFHAVCQTPLKNGREYVRGAKVRLRINELELSTKFLGASKEITLREADAVMLGIIRTPFRKINLNCKV